MLARSIRLIRVCLTVVVVFVMGILLEFRSRVFAFAGGSHVLADIRNVFECHSLFLDRLACLLQVLLIVDNFI